MATKSKTRYNKTQSKKFVKPPKTSGSQKRQVLMRTVAVTPKLDKRMKQASRDTEVNWSMVARKAFRRELDRLDEENV